METDSLFEVPLYFIKENLNGWVIIVILAVVLYIIVLRNYYIKREQFFDRSQQLQNNEEIEDTEEEINTGFEKSRAQRRELEGTHGSLATGFEKSRAQRINDEDENEENEDDNDDDEEDEYDNDDDNEDIKITKSNIKQTNKSKSKIIGENHTKIKGTKVFEGFEGFESPTTANFAKVTNSSNIKPDNIQSKQSSKSTIQLSNTQSIITNNILTTLFDNIKLNTSQINLCKQNYTNVINTYIADLSKLIKLKNNNEYLNIKKQFDVIIAKGIDNIMNYLANIIKSPLILTRISIRTDVINNLSSVIESLINSTNNDLSNQMNSLAIMNSTTIDYKTMLSGINDSRAKLEEYMEIDKLVTNNGKNIGNYDKNINKVLEKSFVLPIYERNFDKINQLVKSDFNDNESNLANKYGQAYTDFLNEKKKDELDVNPMRLASKIESGIVNIITNLINPSSHDMNDMNDMNNNKEEKFELSLNPIPEQQNNLVANTNLNQNANIYNNKSNLGNYLIDKNTQKQVLEGFESNSTNPNTSESATTKYEYKNKSKTNNNTDTDILSNLLSGNFLQYIMETINDKISIFYKYYYDKFGSGTSSGNNGNGKNGNNKNGNNNNNNFNLEENMIPAGFLLFMLSMLFYFVDTTS